MIEPAHHEPGSAPLVRPPDVVREKTFAACVSNGYEVMLGVVLHSLLGSCTPKSAIEPGGRGP
jgi:hypothetical protein